MSKTDIASLERLLVARHPCVSILTFEEEHAIDVVTQAALNRGEGLWLWSASMGVREGILKEATPVDGTENAAAALYYLWTNREIRGLIVLLDLAGHLKKDERVVRLLRDLISRTAERRDTTVILIDASDDLPAVIQGTSARLELSFPGEEELTDIVRACCGEFRTGGKFNVTLNRGELVSLVHNLRGLTRRQAQRAVYEVIVHDRQLDAADIANVIALKRELLSSTGLLEYVEAPTTMDEIGGLRALKAWLAARTRALSDDAQKFGIAPPRGVLLLGVQGAGKSLAAKAVATAWQRPLMRMDVGAFYNQFVGETERQLRDALRQAEMMSPVVLWIDEIEKAFASASAASSSDGGLSKRMFGALLTWMQEHKSAVFLIATANDIDSLPPELMRKGRFDEIFFVDLPTAEARMQIFNVHLKKRKRDPAAFDIVKLVAASDGYSGAEIEQGIIAGLHEAFAKSESLTTAHIESALRGSPPLSVTMREQIEDLRAWAKDRCVPAD